MKKLFNILLILGLFCVQAVFADEVQPEQTIKNTKGFAGINYDRQDSEEVGVQKIVNDHSAFNINIQIIKKGALFQGVNEGAGSSDLQAGKTVVKEDKE